MVLIEITNMEAVNESFTLFNKLGTKFFIRLLVNFIAATILIRGIYYSTYKKQEYVFTLVIFNMVIFLITFLLNKVEMSLGAAFGLFAVFGMLKYRTEDISLKDMTYLFLAIAVGLVCAVTKGSWDELSVICAIILLITWLLEHNIFFKKEFHKNIIYEDIQKIKKENSRELLKDLKSRTGLNIHRISINKIDFLRDTTSITIFYFESKEKESNT